MKCLFIGGTGVMSTEVTALALKKGMDITMINRGNHMDRIPEGVKLIKGDLDEVSVQEQIKDEYYDIVMNFVVYKPEAAERDIRLFNGKCSQYLVVTSACIYEKPVKAFPLTESACVANSPWDYARDKIAMEEVYRKAYKELGFPVTLVRPSHTYCMWSIPVSLGGGWEVVSRILRDKPVVVQGDGLTVWTITHARDVAVGMVGLFGNSHAIGEAVHITTDEIITWDDIYKSIARVLHKEVKLVHISTEMICAAMPNEWGHFMGDISHCAIYDNTKIKRLVPAYHAETTADEGLREAVEYLMAHPEMQKDNPEFDAKCDALVAAYEAFKKSFE